MNWTDDRAISEILGSIFVFALALSVITAVQVYAIPNANQAVEYDHNERVQADLQQLGTAAALVAVTDDPQLVTIEAGTRYPSRLLFYNPPPVTGSLRTEPVGTGTVILANATAVDPTVTPVFDGSTRTYATERLVYRPAYNEYTTAPVTSFDHSALSNRFDADVTLPVSDGAFIEGDRITLLLLSGRVAEDTTGSVSLSVVPISTPVEPTLITGVAGRNVTLTLPTRVPLAAWEERLAAERRDGSVLAVRAVDRTTVSVVLDGTRTYELRIARIGLSTAAPAESRPAPQYLLASDGDGATLTPGETRTLRVQVRDAYGNPVRNVQVNASADQGTLAATSVRTDLAGEARFLYTAPVVDGAVTDSVDASFTVDPADGTAFDAAAPGNVTLTVLVEPESESENAAGDINPNTANTVVLVDEVLGSDGCVSNADCNVTVTLNNTHAVPVTVSQVRYNFYSVDKQGQSSAGQSPEYVVVGDGQYLQMRGPFTAVDGLALPPGENRLSMRFVVDEAGTPFSVAEGDFFIISVRYVREGGDSFTATYFVAPAAGR